MAVTRGFTARQWSVIPPLYHVEAFPVPGDFGVASVPRINRRGDLLANFETVPYWTDHNPTGAMLVVGSKALTLPSPGIDLNDRNEVALDYPNGVDFQVWCQGRTETRHARGLPPGASFTNLSCIDEHGRVGGMVQR